MRLSLNTLLPHIAESALDFTTHSMANVAEAATACKQENDLVSSVYSFEITASYKFVASLDRVCPTIEIR